MLTTWSNATATAQATTLSVRVFTCKNCLDMLLAVESAENSTRKHSIQWCYVLHIGWRSLAAHILHKHLDWRCANVNPDEFWSCPAAATGAYTL
jgi:hypothetical protein